MFVSMMKHPLLAGKKPFPTFAVMPETSSGCRLEERWCAIHDLIM
jgi:hypothetical protein